jgi:hypothetical protein
MPSSGSVGRCGPPRSWPGSAALSALPSLFVLSLPRSLSSLVYRVAADALGLRRPRWVTDGEILNADRLAWLHAPGVTRKGARSGWPAAAIDEYLDAVVQPHGWAYKDVIQPFVTVKWTRRAGVRTLVIRGNVSGSAIAMIDRGEWWPAEIAPHADRILAHVRGLALMKEALDAASHAVHVDASELMADGESLRHALARLYPEVDVPVLPYATEAGFVNERARVLARFGTARYRAVVGMTRIVEHVPWARSRGERKLPEPT